MRTGIDHLPQVQQDELARVMRILMAEFEEATGRATQPWRRNGKIYKIILFGSYARDDWVDEPDNGYQSDFDLLIVVSHKDLTEIADYWYVAEDKILRDQSIGRLVNIIVHSIDEVNSALRRGEYFWVDIVRDGIALYELPQHELATPMPLTPADAYTMAPAISRTGSGRSIVRSNLHRSRSPRGWLKTPPFCSTKPRNGPTTASCSCGRTTFRARTTSSSSGRWRRTASPV